MLDHSVKALVVDDALTTEQLMIPICQSIGIENHIEYSLVWENQPKVISLTLFLMYLNNVLCFVTCDTVFLIFSMKIF